jgi:glutamate-1-semialdehyde 2,1-aminomutase
MTKNTHYQAAFAKAQTLIPNITQLLSKRPDMFSEGIWPTYFSKAKGAYVWDLDDNKYLDMSIGGIGANILGYADDDVNTAVKACIDNGNSCSLNPYEEIQLAEELCTIHQWADMARFSRSGGESMAIAVRIARAHTGKDKIAFCGYHGWHDWYLAANLADNDALNGHLLPGLEPAGVPKALKGTALPFEFNTIDQLETIIKANTNKLAAIVLEPIRGTEPSNEFLEYLSNIQEKHNIVIIIDEISAGFRVRLGGAHLNFNYKPDIAVFSKGLGNGYPIGAIIGKKEVMKAAEKSFISSTYWTERVGYVAALATIKKYKECNVNQHLLALGNRVQDGWKEAAKGVDLDITVRGLKPMGSFSFNYPEAAEMKAYFIQLMLDQGFLASNLYYAMYAHTQNHVDIYLHAVKHSFGEIMTHHKNGTLSQQLKGKPSNSGFKRLN